MLRPVLLTGPKGVRLLGSVKSLGVILVAVLLLGACSSDDGGIDATLKDFQIDLAESSAPAGDVSFKIHNDGPSAHEFVVFKTDLDEGSLPTNEDGDVEEGGELAVVDEAEDIAPDSDVTLDLDLEAGSYVIICNVPGHYGQGMHTSFTVE